MLIILKPSPCQKEVLAEIRTKVLPIHFVAKHNAKLSKDFWRTLYDHVKDTYPRYEEMITWLSSESVVIIFIADDKHAVLEGIKDYIRLKYTLYIMGWKNLIHVSDFNDGKDLQEYSAAMQDLNKSCYYIGGCD